MNPRAEGKRSGSAEIRPHTPIVTYATLVFPLARGIFNFFYETMKDLRQLDNQTVQLSNQPKPQNIQRFSQLCSWLVLPLRTHNV